MAIEITVSRDFEIIAKKKNDDFGNRNLPVSRTGLLKKTRLLFFPQI